jgi:hypothetical protein
MDALKDRRVLAAVGGAVVLLIAILFALFLVRQPKAPKLGQDAKATGALSVDVGQTDAKVSQTKPLRCFVGGQFVGLFTIQDCAKRNGVAAQALDVGLDPQTGQVAASGGAVAALQPLNAPMAASIDPGKLAPAPEVAVAAPAQTAGGAECLRYSGDAWRAAGGGTSLGQCARTLFDGRCIRAGDALYGRWNGQTLRLVTGRVEISSDNRNFHTLVQQDPQDCSLPAG